MENKKIFIILIFLFLFPIVSSAHYIVGQVNDALDGEFANNKEIILWNYNNGISDNITAVVGPNGPSGTDNIYMLDCEMLSSSCSIGDILIVKIYNLGDGYVSSEINLTVTSAGYDMADNLTLNSLPVFDNIVVDDAINLTIDEIDLFTNSTVEVFCSTVVEELEGESLSNIYSEFFSTEFSSFGGSEDNNYHYTNNSCEVDVDYGNENQTRINCSYEIQYYAYSDIWNCVISADDELSTGKGMDSTFINPLLSIEVVDEINFATASTGNVSDEVEVVIKNAGNVEVDLSLSGYGLVPDDNLAMTCFGNKNISVYYNKYNLISSIVGDLSLSEFENNYINLTGSSTVKDFNLPLRENDGFNEAFKSTYWRIYVPLGISGMCEGNIVISAVMSA